jgi:integrase
MLYKRGRYYSIRFKWQGGIVDKSTRATDKKTARKIEAKIRAELAEGNFGILQKKAACPTLGDFLTNDFWPFIEGKFNDRPNTQTYYEYGKNLEESGLAKLGLDEISDQHAALFAAHRGKWSPSTVNCALRTLRRALNLAEVWKKLDRAPKITLATGERQRERVLTDEEMKEYLMACAQPWRDVATIMYCLGLRPSEIYTLRWEQIRLTDQGFIQITKGKSKAARRTLPIVPAVHKILASRHRGQAYPLEGWVFTSQSKSGHLEQGSAKNQHLRAVKAVNKTSAEAAKRAGVAEPEVKLKPFAPYCIRHTALTNLASQCDTFSLKTIAGHSTITITQRYVHPQAEAISEAFKKLAERQNGVTDGGDNTKSLVSDIRPDMPAVNSK